MLIKLDHKVSWAIAEDREDVIEQMTRSSRMYSWYKGEDIGDTIDRFAVANKDATFGDMVEWSKTTYLARLQMSMEGVKFTAYRMGSYDPTGTVETKRREETGTHGRKVELINDGPRLIPRQRTDLKKVAEPGDEAKVDAEDQAALDAMDAALGEQKDGPGTPDNPAAPPSVIPPSIEEGQGADPLDPPQKPDPIAGFKKK